MEQRASESTAGHDEALKASLAVLPLGVFTVDANGTLLVAAGEVFESLGLSQLVPGSSVFIEDSGLPDWLVEHVGHALQLGQPADVEDVHEGRTFHLTLRPIHAAGDQVAWVVGSLQELPNARADVEREELLAIERQARAQAEEAMRREAFISEASRKLATSIDWTDTVNTIAMLAIPELADAGAVLVVDGERLRPVAAIHHDPRRTEMMRTMFEKYPPDLRGPVGMGHIVLTGETVFLREVPDSFLMAIARSNEHLELLRKIAMKSYLGVPMVGHGRVLGVMVFATLFRHFRASNVGLVEELGRRCGAALENAQLYREVQAAVRTREDFLAVASHELRTPLTPLNLLLTRLERMLGEGQAAELTRRARRSVDRLRSLVGDLLDVAQLDAGSLRLRMNPFSLRDTVTQLVQDYAPTSEQHHFELEAGDDPLLVLGERGRVEQVIANLLDNAIKFSPDGGEIRVRLHSADGKVRLSVEDSGIGIEPDQQDRVFSRFFRANNTSVMNYGGLGLGLYISREIVNRHQGRIWVRSNVGKGSTFFVELPLAG